MPSTNQALWLMKAKDTEMVVDKAPYPKAGSGELIIQAKAIAINPADVLLQQTGMLLTKYPAILGCDVAGVVQEVGSDLTTIYDSGDRVIGAGGPLEDYRYSTFQDYVVLKAPSIAKVPSSTSLSDAVVLPLGINTALSCLYDKDGLALELPPSDKGSGKTLLIWGASGSVGSCGVQLAAAAGYEVFAVASKHNHGMLKSIGAVSCFDHHDPNVVRTIVEALHGKDIVGAFDAVSIKETLQTVCEILHQSKGKPLVAAVKPGSEAHAKLDVTIRTNFASVIGDATKVIWEKFLEPGLAAGTVHCKPDAQVVGHGLHEVQKAVNQLAAGVSAKKLVVTL